MVEVQVVYRGELHTTSVHGPSQAQIETDAPIDNHGKGQAFSPTDLVASSLGSCMLTVMGILADRQQWSLEGASARIEKHMASEGTRRISRLVAEIKMPSGLPPESHQPLMFAAQRCPVRASLHPEIDIVVNFHWEEAS